MNSKCSQHKIQYNVIMETKEQERNDNVFSRNLNGSIHIKNTTNIEIKIEKYDEIIIVNALSLHSGSVLSEYTLALFASSGI
mmetsp:Transcript_58185/g.52407  ORF Transcript_58185/g.52407 Transcript_58185/m.52407 type:complete len:82 (+) Transcript_58185:9-254(+)